MARQELIEGSMAVARAVARCRPNVISAYPITPQTHIVENLSQIVADGELDAEFAKVESEFAAASVCLGAVAAGARAYTATSSQGLILMSEVLFNLAGMRLPLVLTCANRSVSAPLSIWCDHSDSMAIRDAGMLHFYAEDAQEAVDMHILATRIGEDRRVLLPVLVGIDGFLITHLYEPVEVPDAELVDEFLPPYDPIYKLDPADPRTFGAFTEPDKCMEGRYMIHEACVGAIPVIEEISAEFARKFGRSSGGFLECYRSDDADTILVAMGSVCGTIKDAIDSMRDAGKKVGLVRVKCFRPLPVKALLDALGNAKRIAILEKAGSFGGAGILSTEIKEVLFDADKRIPVSGFCVSLGGREVTEDGIVEIAERIEKETVPWEYFRLKRELLPS